MWLLSHLVLTVVMGWLFLSFNKAICEAFNKAQADFEALSTYTTRRISELQEEFDEARQEIEDFKKATPRFDELPFSVM